MVESMLIINSKYKDNINQVCNAASIKAVNPIYENVCISHDVDGIVSVKAGDSVIEISKIIVADNFSESINVCVNAAKFSSAFNACNGDVTLTYDDDKCLLFIASKGRCFKLPTKDINTYPVYQDGGLAVQLNCDCFINKVKSVSWSSASDDVRYQLNGVHIGKHAVATDGFKMSIIDIDSGLLDSSFTIPINSVQKMPVVDNYKVEVSSNILTISTEDTVFKTILVDARYPDYMRVIRNQDKIINVDILSLIDAVQAASVTVDKKKNAISITFSDECLVCAGNQTGEFSTIPFDATVDCEEFVFNVNASYLLSALKSFDTQFLDIGFTSDNSQLIIKNDDSTVIVMGVKI